MNRKQFLEKFGLLTAAVTIAPSFLVGRSKEKEFEQNIEEVFSRGERFSDQIWYLRAEGKDFTLERVDGRRIQHIDKNMVKIVPEFGRKPQIGDILWYDKNQNKFLIIGYPAKETLN